MIGGVSEEAAIREERRCPTETTAGTARSTAVDTRGVGRPAGLVTAGDTGEHPPSVTGTSVGSAHGWSV
jgi:hypothetical protein